jgi:hypothetical protein
MADDGDPGDAALLAGLDLTAQAWSDVLRLSDDFAAVTYPAESPEVNLACRALYAVGAVSPAYDWMHRPLVAAPPQGAELQPADAIRAATGVIRGERFCEGTIAQALEDGLFQSVLRSLATWLRSREQL